MIYIIGKKTKFQGETIHKLDFLKIFRSGSANSVFWPMGSAEERIMLIFLNRGINITTW